MFILLVSLRTEYYDVFTAAEQWFVATLLVKFFAQSLLALLFCFWLLLFSLLPLGEIKMNILHVCSSISVFLEARSAARWLSSYGHRQLFWMDNWTLMVKYFQALLRHVFFVISVFWRFFNINKIFNTPCVLFISRFLCDVILRANKWWWWWWWWCCRLLAVLHQQYGQPSLLRTMQR